MFSKKCIAILVTHLVLSATGLHATLLSIEAVDNATVQPTGPRSGANGKAFFNIEGENNNNFASYGVADFNFGPQPPTVAITSARLKLTQSNSSFTSGGLIVISLDTRPTPVGIQPGSSPLAYVPPVYGTFQDESQGDLVLNYIFNFDTFTPEFLFQPVATGALDTYSFLDPIITPLFLNRLNTGSNIRIVIAPADPFVAATWAGSTNSIYSGPTLELDVVQIPEPSCLVLALVGCGVCSLGKRQESAT